MQLKLIVNLVHDVVASPHLPPVCVGGRGKEGGHFHSVTAEIVLFKATEMCMVQLKS